MTEIPNNSKFKTKNSKFPFGLLLVLAVIVITLDQLTKWLVAANIAGKAPVPIIEGFARLRYTENRGAAFGFFQGWGGALSIAAIAVVIAIVYSASRMGGNRLGLAALGLITGGAMGNLIDRLRLGYVVDFIDVYGPRITIDHTPYTFPVFNVADSSITIGAILLVATFLFTSDPSQPQSDARPNADLQEANTNLQARADSPSALSTQQSALGWAGLAVMLTGLLLMAFRMAKERS